MGRGDSREEILGFKIKNSGEVTNSLLAELAGTLLRGSITPTSLSCPVWPLTRTGGSGPVLGLTTGHREEACEPWDTEKPSGPAQVADRLLGGSRVRRRQTKHDAE